MTAWDVIEQRLIGAAYAYLLLTAAVALVFAGLLVGASIRGLVRRVMRHNAQRRAQFLRSTVEPVAQTEPGIGLSVQDDLELLWSMDAYDGLDLDAGLARLRQAIRDEQQKEADDA